jgi:rhodanese-related sulfurtransferase
MREVDRVKIIKRSILRLLLVSLGMGVLLASSCSHFQGSTPGSETQNQIIKNIDPKEAYTLALKNKANQSFVILGVRTPTEFTDGHIENAVNSDYKSETFKKALDNLDHNKIYLIYCGVGSRGWRASDLMKELGFGEVSHIAGGLTEWKKAGLPTTKKIGFHGFGVQLANLFRISWIECVRAGTSTFELQDCRA